MNSLDHNNLCKEAESHYYDLICDQNHLSVPDLIIKHIQQCQHCAQRIEQLKKMLSETTEHDESGRNRVAVNKCLELHFAYTGEQVTCQAVRPFLPALLDAAVEIKIPTPVTLHLDNCEQCRQDMEIIQKLNLDRKQLWELAQILTGQSSGQDNMQKLQDIALRITKRPESGVVTTYEIDESTEAEVSVEPGFGSAVASDRLKVKHHRRILIARILKSAIAAAAVILIAVGLLVNVPSVQATGFGQVFGAIKQIKNVYITQFSPVREGRIQEQWVSRELNVCMFKTDGELVLWDIGNSTRKIKSVIGAVETMQLTETRIKSIEKKISGTLGLVPFGSMSDVPEDHRWEKVTENFPRAAAEGLEVYELTWLSRNFSGFPNSSTPVKLRFYVDPQTYLPERVECYQKFLADEEYSLASRHIVKSLEKSEVQAVLKSMGF